ncbi:protein-l-isoaspartate(d-aspartate) o-methyltransferase [Anaeramoeba ignava]|uniref:protein-L-isoaspartate(D-aspartate) O-methyltransferase n=1 Tax=Anaeramoeba ignava TaxID=1746090 RepID=A0A9Q0L5A2_ANAIG|nr:protein-l-isoaspartate(d-aspartate) o-methyltransferase [Anaeramoeba ignava]
MQNLINHFIQKKIITYERIAEAFEVVDRKNFVNDPNSEMVYQNEPLSLGFGAVISSPQIYAIYLSLLFPKLFPGSKVLDIGSGKGYSMALIGTIIGPKGKVYGVEHVPELVEESKKALEKDQPELYKKGVFEVFEKDGFEGLPDFEPYDAILVGGACEKIPENILLQLKPYGRMVIPIGSPNTKQKLTIIDKMPDGKIAIFTNKQAKFSSLMSLEDQLKI